MSVLRGLGRGVFGWWCEVLGAHVFVLSSWFLWGEGRRRGVFRSAPGWRVTWGVELQVTARKVAGM